MSDAPAITGYRAPTEEERQATKTALHALAEDLRAQGWTVTIAELMRNQFELRVRLPFGETGPSSEEKR